MFWGSNLWVRFLFPSCRHASLFKALNEIRNQHYVRMLVFLDIIMLQFMLEFADYYYNNSVCILICILIKQCRKLFTNRWRIGFKISDYINLLHFVTFIIGTIYTPKRPFWNKKETLYLVKNSFGLFLGDFEKLKSPQNVSFLWKTQNGQCAWLHLLELLNSRVGDIKRVELLT